MTIQKIKSGRVNVSDVTSFIGNNGQLFYDEKVGDLYLSDGVTPGGKKVGVSGGGLGNIILTSRGIVFVSGSNSIEVTAGSNLDRSFLAEDSTGSPYWTNVIDGGLY